MEGASAGSRRKRGRPRKIIEGRFTDLTFVPESLSDAPTTRSNVRIWSGTRVPKIPRTSSKSPERTDTSSDQSVSQSPYNTRRGRRCPCKSGIGLAIIKKDKGVVAIRTEANMAPESKDTDKVEENLVEKVEENEKEKDPAENLTERSAGENVEDAAKAEILGELENYAGKTGPSFDDLTEGKFFFSQLYFKWVKFFKWFYMFVNFFLDSSDPIPWVKFY